MTKDEINRLVNHFAFDLVSNGIFDFLKEENPVLDKTRLIQVGYLESLLAIFDRAREIYNLTARLIEGPKSPTEVHTIKASSPEEALAQVAEFLRSKGNSEEDIQESLKDMKEQMGLEDTPSSLILH